MTGRPDPALLDRFAAIVGDKHVLRFPDDMEPFVTELRSRWPGKAAMVLKPGSTEEVAAILRLATESGTPIVPQGGNTGLVGGQMPDGSGAGIVVTLSRMNRIRELDTASSTITVEAGVILQNLQAAANDAGFLFPLALGSQGSCQIGGNLSSNAGGTGVLAFGNARELCLGVEVVLPTGEILDDLRKLKKDNTGYDLKNLFVGAEGTLGIITAAVMRLYPQPKGREVAWIGLATPGHALNLFQLVSARAGPSLTAFELIERRPLDFAVCHTAGSIAPLEGQHDWHVLMEISSGRSADDARDLTSDILISAYESTLIEDAAIAASLGQAEAFWRLRETIPEAQRMEGASIKHDISVPVAAIPEFIERAGAAVLELAPKARIVCFGHMGDGNLHYNISEPEGGDPDFATLDEAVHARVHGVVRALNGSISAEHGIGQMKRDELIATAPAVGIDLMRRIKAAFDPAGIMNPGKVI